MEVLRIVGWTLRFIIELRNQMESGSLNQSVVSEQTVDCEIDESGVYQMIEYE